MDDKELYSKAIYVVPAAVNTNPDRRPKLDSPASHL